MCWSNVLVAGIAVRKNKKEPETDKVKTVQVDDEEPNTKVAPSSERKSRRLLASKKMPRFADANVSLRSGTDYVIYTV